MDRRLRHGTRGAALARRAARLLAGACAALAIAGCSAVGMAYKNADRLMLDRLEKFVELDPDQRAALGNALEAGLARHQRQSLPVLVARLRETRALVAGGLDGGDADRVLALGRELYRDTADSLIADIAPVLATLDAAQVDELAERMAGERARVREERLADPPPVRAERRAERTIDRIEDWTGRLDEDQRALVTRLAARVPSRTEAWLAFSEAQERALLAALRGGADAGTLARRLRAWWIEDGERDPEFRELSRRAEAAWAELLARLDATLTRGQRERAVGKLDRYAEVFDGLAREAVSS